MHPYSQAIKAKQHSASALKIWGFGLWLFEENDSIEAEANLVVALLASMKEQQTFAYISDVWTDGWEAFLPIIIAWS